MYTGIGAFTYFYQRAQQQLNGLMEVFKLLNNQYHTRQSWFATFREGKAITELDYTIGFSNTPVWAWHNRGIF